MDRTSTEVRKLRPEGVILQVGLRADNPLYPKKHVPPIPDGKEKELEKCGDQEFVTINLDDKQLTK